MTPNGETDTPTDAEWLRAYADQGDERAFRELVQRHLNLVYSAALRQAGGDRHRAQDVSQTVFTDLASKAKSLPREVLLGGWLYRHTNYVAAKTLRSERRRQSREGAAVEMNRLQSNDEEMWRQIAPVLDNAMSGLNQRDRDALVLRFFEQRSLSEVGAALGLGEDAVRMRVNRALEKLRTVLTKRGVSSTAAALVRALGEHAVGAAPAGLAQTLHTAALAATGAATVSTGSLLTLMTSTKLKIGLVAIVAAGVVTPVVLQHRSLARMRADNQLLQQQTGELAQLREDRDRLAKLQVDAEERARRQRKHKELLRLRGEVALLRKESQELASLRTKKTSTLAATTPPQAGGYLGAEAWANVGNDNPESALQTLLWAAKSKDDDLVGRLIRWRKDASLPQVEEIDEILRGVVPAVGKFTKDLAGVRVIAQKDEDAETKRMRVEFTSTDGKTEAREFQFVREDTGWLPLFHASSPHEGSIQGGFDVPLTAGLDP